MTNTLREDKSFQKSLSKQFKNLCLPLLFFHHQLQKIMECNNRGDLEVFPVFYGVDPSDVRHQKGSYEEAFGKHQKKFGQHSDRVEKWRDALTRVAGYSGWASKDQHEAELVEIIAQRIHEKLVPKLPSCTENLVGIASKVEEVKKLIGMRLNDVCFIGICGMGGIGKTTIARAVFEAIRGEFEVTCFLDNVREDSEKNGLHKTYEVVTLLQKEALSLFCLKAFKGNKPQEGYLDLSKKVVEYSGGLPLALEVLGSYLCGRNIDVWHSAVKKLTSMPHPEIRDNLMISYEGLDSMEKNIFLDIACFFKGHYADSVIDILENCGYSAQIVIDVLVERSLITLRSDESYPEILYVEMHDLLQQMGRDIVIQEYPDDPTRRSRLWSLKDIDYVMTNNKGTEKINGIYCNIADSGWSTEAFSNMSQLKYFLLALVACLVH